MILSRLKKAIREQNWFAVVLEVCIVVLGVVIGFQITAWGNDRAAQAEERVYLRQLAAELDATARRLESSIGAMRNSMGVSSKLLTAFNEPERADPDSVALWLTTIVQTNRPGLALGVARALVNNDLSLVRDDSVRTAIFDLLTHADRLEAWDGPTFATFIDYANQLRSVVPMTTRMSLRSDSVALNRYYPVLPFSANRRRVAFPIDSEAFLANREAYTAIDGLYDMAADMRVFQTFMLNRVREVQDVLARRGITVEPEEGS